MPQQRRAQLTRRAILIAAAEEFDRVGYDATSLNAILRRGGITKGAFYFHFSSKEDVAEALARLYRRYRLDVWHRWARRGLDPLSTAVGLTAEIASVIERDVVLRAGMVREYRQAGQKVSPLLLELLRKAAEKGALRPGLDPDAAARVLHAALLGLGASGGGNLAGRMAEVWRVLLSGVAGDEWLRRHGQNLANLSRGSQKSTGVR